jgi:hypothetical protein
LELLGAAVERRKATRLMEEMLVMNRATHGDEKSWTELRELLSERRHTGLTYIAAPAADPNAPAPRPRPFLHQTRRKK